jgi:hypothetical protein
MAFFDKKEEERENVRLRCFLLFAQHIPRFMVVSVLPAQENDRIAPVEAILSPNDDWWQALPDIDINIDFSEGDWNDLMPLDAPEEAF